MEQRAWRWVEAATLQGGRARNVAGYLIPHIVGRRSSRGRRLHSPPTRGQRHALAQQIENDVGRQSPTLPPSPPI